MPLLCASELTLSDSDEDPRRSPQRTNSARRPAVFLGSSVPSTPSICVGKHIWLLIGVLKLPPNAGKYSVIAESSSPTPLAHWHTCKSAAHLRYQETKPRQRPPIKTSF